MENLKAKPNTSSTRRVVIDRTAVVYGQTPLAMRKKQLKSMAAEQDLDLSTFCRQILSLSEADQFKMLRHHYENANDTLGKFFKEFDPHSPGKHESTTEKFDQTTPSRRVRKGCHNLKAENRHEAPFTKDSVRETINSNNLLREVETKADSANVTSPDSGSEKGDFVSTGRNSLTSVLASSKDTDEYQSVITTLLFNGEDSELKKRMKDLSKRRKLSPTKRNTVLESLLFE